MIRRRTHHMNFLAKIFNSEISTTHRMAFLLTIAASMDCHGSTAQLQAEHNRQARQTEARLAHARQTEQRQERARQATARLAASRQESGREEEERARRERQKLARVQAMQEQRRRRYRCNLLRRRSELVMEANPNKPTCGHRGGRLESDVDNRRRTYCC